MSPCTILSEAAISRDFQKGASGGTDRTVGDAPRGMFLVEDLRELLLRSWGSSTCFCEEVEHHLHLRHLPSINVRFAHHASAVMSDSRLRRVDESGDRDKASSSSNPRPHGATLRAKGKVATAIIWCNRPPPLQMRARDAVALGSTCKPASYGSAQRRFKVSPRPKKEGGGSNRTESMHGAGKQLI